MQVVIFYSLIAELFVALSKFTPDFLKIFIAECIEPRVMIVWKKIYKGDLKGLWIYGVEFSGDIFIPE